MSFLESLRVALSSLLANKMRSFLTMLGIIIGVSAVIAMVAIGEGTSSSITSSIQGLGSNLLIVTSGQAQQGGVKLGAGSLDTLTLEDAEALQKIDAIAAVAPAVTKQVPVVWRNQNYTTSIEGSNEQYAEVRSINTESGRLINKYDVEGQANVAVVGPTVVENLFGNSDEDVIGRTIEINQMSFTIIGVLESQGNSGMMNNDDRIIIPITTAMNRLFGLNNIKTIYISATSEEVIDFAQQDIETALRVQHNLSPNDENDFKINSQAQILDTAKSITGLMTTLLAGIAAISLVVGGIGIMNIMLVSVTERTKEIGIRKAIGASFSDILTQFLIESVMLSFLGGAIGVLLGVGFSQLVSNFTSLKAIITISPIVYAFLVSSIVGIVFGVYPAQKAARLNPIEALRFE